MFSDVMGPAASHLIEFFGEGRTATLRQKRGGSTVATVTDVEFAVLETNIFGAEGFEFGDKLLLIAADEFSGQRLDTSWSFEESGGLEIRVSGPFEPVAPGGEVLYYQAVMKTGSGR